MDIKRRRRYVFKAFWRMLYFYFISSYLVSIWPKGEGKGVSACISYYEARSK